MKKKRFEPLIYITIKLLFIPVIPLDLILNYKRVLFCKTCWNNRCVCWKVVFSEFKILDLTFGNLRSSGMINFGSSQFNKLIYRKCVFSLVLSLDSHCLNTSSSWKLPFVPSCTLKHFFHDTLNSDAPCNFYLTNHKHKKLHSKS